MTRKSPHIVAHSLELYPHCAPVSSAGASNAHLAQLQATFPSAPQDQAADAPWAGYSWDIERDAMTWDEGALGVLGLPANTDISSATSFEQFVFADNGQRRLDMILGDATDVFEQGAAGACVPYRSVYRLEGVQPQGLSRADGVWVEDFGQCWFGEHGHACLARGALRVVGEDYVRAQRRRLGADFDEHTGQITRNRLLQSLDQVVKSSSRDAVPAGFLLASIDNLAVINESMGYDVGDEMIAAAARLIGDEICASDTVGRFSSTKFGVVLPLSTARDVRRTAERILSAVRRTSLFTNAGKMAVTISIGGVFVPEHAQDTDQVLNCAMDALAHARSMRGDSFVSFEPDCGRDNKRQRSIHVSDEIIGALEGDRISLALQPMVSASTGEPTYYECLARLQKADGEDMPPAEFIPLGEELGLSRLIDRRVLTLAVDLLDEHAWLKLSINVSSLTANDPDWIGELRALVGDRPTLAERLVVEITETAVIDDYDHVLAFIDTVKELGCKVAIDDFGAGYTSFKNLKRLPVDMVKIDGSFVQNLSSDSGDQVFVRTMAELANTFGMEIVAEWVGDQASAKMLRECGITYLQGFLYGEPFGAETLRRPSMVKVKRR